MATSLSWYPQWDALFPAGHDSHCLGIDLLTNVRVSSVRFFSVDSRYKAQDDNSHCDGRRSWRQQGKN